MLIKKLLLVISGMLMALPSFSRDFKYTYEGQELKYTVVSEENRTCMTKRGTQEESPHTLTGSLVIPAVAKAGKKEYTVIGIGYNSFGFNRDLTSVKLPETIIEIEPFAFYKCNGLNYINIPGAVGLIGKGAFACANLQELVIEDSDSPLDIHTNMFGNGIRKAYIGRNIKLQCEESVLAPHTIFDEGLAQVAFGNKVTEIPEDMFYECKGLASVTLPESLKSIGFRAFSRCTALVEISLPNSVAEIGKDAFHDCEKLRSVAIPASVTQISDYTFCNCKSLASVALPKSVTTIGNYAFDDCSSLSSIELPETLKSIGEMAFCDSGLTSITLPASLEYLGPNAFWGTKISEVTMPDDFFTTLERKKYAFGGTPYYRDLESSANNVEADKLRKAVAGTWRVVNFDRNEGSITFNANGTYVCNFQKSKISDFYFTFTEKGTWEFSTASGKSYVKLKITSVGPSAVITPCPTASAYQKKLPGTFARMTSAQKSEFLREYAKNREFRMLSAKEMQNSTYGYDIEKNFKLLK